MRSEHSANDQMHAHAIARAQRQAQQGHTARRVSLDCRPPSRARQWLGVVAIGLVMACPMFFDALMR